MISEEKILIYKKYEGDPDAWARIGTTAEKNMMSDEDWYLIDLLIQDIVISKGNLDRILDKNTENEKVKEEIINIAKHLL